MSFCDQLGFSYENIENEKNLSLEISLEITCKKKKKKKQEYETILPQVFGFTKFSNNENDLKDITMFS